MSDSGSDGEERAAGPRAEAAPLGDLAEQARQRQLPKWVPRSEFSRLRFKVLAETSNIASWHRCCWLSFLQDVPSPPSLHNIALQMYRALELHAEMKRQGLELPAAEMLEIIEVCA